MRTIAPHVQPLGHLLPRDGHQARPRTSGVGRLNDLHILQNEKCAGVWIWNKMQFPQGSRHRPTPLTQTINTQERRAEIYGRVKSDSLLSDQEAVCLQLVAGLGFEPRTFGL